MVTDGDKSLTPGGKLEGGLPNELLWGGCGTDKLGRLLKGEGVNCGANKLDLPGCGCCKATQINFFAPHFESEIMYPPQERRYAALIRLVRVTVPRMGDLGLLNFVGRHFDRRGRDAEAARQASRGQRRLWYAGRKNGHVLLQLLRLLQLLQQHQFHFFRAQLFSQTP